MASSLRFFEYLRKSSESEERQELSIPAQHRELAAVAERRGLHIVGDPIEESRSAKEPGRPLFSAMLQQIREGKADGILCWKLDRLARNPLDGGALMWALGDRTIKQIVTPERTYVGNGEDKLLMSIMFGMATKYSDDLSDNVKRGNREALERGRWPHHPKLGYRRDPETKEIVPDPERFPIVQKMWELLLAGTPPLTVLEKLNGTHGLRTPRRGRAGGIPLSKSRFYVILHDPFYAGVMVHGGLKHKGNHTPVISLAEFERVQELIGDNRRQQPEYRSLEFTYRGLIRCGRCGAMVTAQNTINRAGKRYKYYYCCRKEKRYSYCSERSIEEQGITDAVGRFVADLVPKAPRFFAEVSECLKDLLANDRGVAEAGRDLLQQEQERIAAQLRRLRLLCADQVISEDEYRADRDDLVAKQLRIEEELERAENQFETDVKHLADAASLLDRAEILFHDADHEQKRQLLRELTSNMLLQDRKLHIQAKNTFVFLRSLHGIPATSARKEQIQIYLAKQGHGMS